MRGRWPQHRHRAEGHKVVERAHVSTYGSWCRQVIRFMTGRVAHHHLELLLDQRELKHDYDAGLSAERAAEVRIDRLR